MASIKTNVKQLIGKSLDLYNKTHMKAAHDRIDNIVAQAGTDNTELVDARIDTAGVKHTTLNNRIKAETKIMGERLQEVSGEYITVENTVSGPITDIEILGNTTQDPNNLVDIKSVGDLQEDGTYKMSILSCNKNLINEKTFEDNTIYYQDTGKKDNNSNFKAYKVKLKPNVSYFLTNVTSGATQVVMYKNGTRVHGGFDLKGLINRDIDEIAISVSKSVTNPVLQLEEGAVATPYTPHQSNKSSILSPVPLGNGDRLYYDNVEGAWCIDKVETRYMFSNSDNWTYNATITGNGTNKAYMLTNVIQNVKYKHSELMIMCDKYKSKPNYSHEEDIEGVMFISANSLVVRTNKTLDELKTSLHGGYLLYPTTTPTKIVLPKTQQLALNSFFDKTHIYFGTEVEGTFKGKVAKSMGASLESLHNKTNILTDRVINTRAVFNQRDAKTAVLMCTLKLTEPLNLTDCMVTADILKPDGTKTTQLCQVVDATEGVVAVGLTPQCLSAIGEVRCELVVRSETQTLYSPVLTYTVNDNLFDLPDDEITSLDEYPVLTQLITLVQNMEQTVSELEVLLQTNELNRESSETAREINETERQTYMESVKPQFQEMINTFNSKVDLVNSELLKLNNTVDGKVEEVDNKILEINTTIQTIVETFNDKITIFNSKIELIDSNIDFVTNKCNEIDTIIGNTNTLITNVETAETSRNQAEIKRTETFNSLVSELEVTPNDITDIIGMIGGL